MHRREWLEGGRIRISLTGTRVAQAASTEALPAVAPFYHSRLGLTWMKKHWASM